jgi:hypothetical protein
MAKVKGDIEVEAGKHGVKIGMHKSVEAGAEAGEAANVTERATGMGRR